MQVVQYYLDQIVDQSQLNVFLEVFSTEALTKAMELDEQLRTRPDAPRGKLFGVVIGIKDVICYKGHKVRAASKILGDFESVYSATAVERLLAEDAIILGSLNCDEFGMGSTNENSAFGPVRNAYDQTKVPGGSSGGSAVAIQADMCMIALGSDTGGSVRQPASFCDVVGFKPSYGRISRHGLIAYASSFDQIGLLTKSVEDAALSLEIMAGPDAYDATCLQEEPVTYSQLFHPSHSSDKPLKIAYIQQCLDHPGLDPEIRENMRAKIDQLTQAGHKVSAVDFPYMDQIVATYYILTTAEASSNLSRYDGVHFAYRAKDTKNLEEVYTKTRTAGFGMEVKRRIMLGTFVLSAGYFDAYYGQAQKVRRILQTTSDKIYEAHDLIVLPTTTSTAFELGAKQDPVSVYLSDVFTVLANLIGSPAISLPLFKHSNGMPYGLQLLTKRGADAALLSAAHQISSMRV